MYDFRVSSHHNAILFSLHLLWPLLPVSPTKGFPSLDNLVLSDSPDLGPDTLESLKLEGLTRHRPSSLTTVDSKRLIKRAYRSAAPPGSVGARSMSQQAESVLLQLVASGLHTVLLCVPISFYVSMY